MDRSRVIALARDLRINMTHGEQRLWNELRRRQLGVKFRRQHPIGPYVADLASPSARLVVEIDGVTHETAYDEHRDRWMEARGWRVMRVTLEEVEEHFEEVVDAIRLELEEPGTMLTYWKRSGVDPS
jgi:very-short-patch-repair endonuclease